MQDLSRGIITGTVMDKRLILGLEEVKEMFLEAVPELPLKGVGIIRERDEGECSCSQ